MPDLTPDELAAVKARHPDIPQDALTCDGYCPMTACPDCPYRPEENP